MTYLGIHTTFNRSKKEDYKEMLEKINKRLEGWKSKLLSQAGRSMLIRTVASTIHTYQMSTHMLPKSIYKSLNIKGGLGLRKMESMNVALLAKTGWEMSQPNVGIWHKLLTKKYLKSTTFTNVASKNTDSSLWKGILKTRPLLEKCMCFNITNGSSVKVWFDLWIPSMKNFKPLPLNPQIDLSQGLKVSDLINQINRLWDLQKLQLFFQPTNRFIWTKTQNGRFSIKSAHHIASNMTSSINTVIPNISWKKIWKFKIHDRHKFLLWKILWNILPTRERLKRFISSIPSTNCHFCDGSEETLLHLFIECPLSRILWSQSNWPLNLAP
ncbi:hypothetical protein CIPAW_09G081400 [Carya illinoinensis]|uniref:Reverse transcriptase zinc-binding domain-containing protein n=1 Tax=Carya illinoinensis TaxID=32201 RepID=A0A8T1PME3_CARIL|nr:hypothetical protein CIPAW_09G081400 [Carya illinoinensis]